MESYAGAEASQGCASLLGTSPLGSVALGASVFERDKNGIVVALTTILGMKNSNALSLFLHLGIISLLKAYISKGLNLRCGS